MVDASQDCKDESEKMVMECYFPWIPSAGGATQRDTCYHCGPDVFELNFIERLGPRCAVSYMSGSDPRNNAKRICYDDEGKGTVGLVTSPGFPVRFAHINQTQKIVEITFQPPGGIFEEDQIYTFRITVPMGINTANTFFWYYFKLNDTAEDVVAGLIDGFYSNRYNFIKDLVTPRHNPTHPDRLQIVGATDEQAFIVDTFPHSPNQNTREETTITTIQHPFEAGFDAFGETITDFGFEHFFASGGPKGRIVYLSKDTDFEYFPCQPFYTSGADANFTNSTMLCRTIILAQDVRHQLICNKTVLDLSRTWVDTQSPLHPIPQQHFWKPQTIRLNARNEPIVWMMTSAAATSCYLYMNAYCFSDAEVCLTSGDVNRIWTCVGPPVGAINTLYVDFTGRHSESQFKYPNPNASSTKGDVWLRNQIFKNASEQMPFGLTHDSNALYNSPKLNHWHSEGWEENANLVIDYYLGSLTFGTPIPIKRMHLRSRVTFPMQLILDTQTTDWYPSLLRAPPALPNMPDNAFAAIRVTGPAHVIITVKPKLLPAAYSVVWDYQFMYPDDPFDLRIEDPNFPGVEVTEENFVNYGPHNERIGLRQRWIGLDLPFPWGEATFIENHNLGCDFTVMQHSVKGWQNKSHFQAVTDAGLPEWENRYLGNLTTVLP